MRPMMPRSAALPLIAMSIVVVFTAQQLRLFVSGISFALSDARGVPPEIAVLVGAAVSALALLAATFLSSVNRSQVVGLVSIVCLARLGSQVVEEPLFLLALASVGVVSAGMTFPAIALVHGGRITGTGLILGGAIDIALMGARSTLDLTRSSSLAAIAAVVGMSVIALGALGGERQASGFARHGPSIPAAAAFTVGPWLAVHLTVTGNLGFIGATTGLGLGSASAVAAAGALVALVWAAPGQSAPHPAAAATVATVALFSLGGADSGVAAFLIFVVSVASGSALTGVFERDSTGPRERVAWASGAGMATGFIGMLVVYLPVAGFGIDPQWTLSLLGLALMGPGIASIPTQSHRGDSWALPAVVSALLLVVPLILIVNADADVGEPLSGDPFVLTYNLHHGFSGDGVMALESMAQIIESADPDIVALQEVSRGWVATGGVDMVAWFEHRLGMPVVFAPTADRQWGVALATRLPTTNPLIIPLGGEDGLSRAALDVFVDVSNEQPLRVIVTQLHQTEADQAIRQIQINDLLVAWGTAPRTLIVGDLATGPDDEITSQLFAAGLVDAGRLVEGSAATWPAENPVRQHDYILRTPDLAVSVVRVLPLVASDHLAVQVRVGSIGVIQSGATDE